MINIRPLPSLDILNSKFKVVGGRLLRDGKFADTYINDSGYRMVSIHDRQYRAHRVVFAIIHSKIVFGVLDHINGDRQDNRPANLREVDTKTNAQNIRKAHTDNMTTGLPGVSPNGKRGYMAKICVEGKQTYLGTYRSPEEAHAVYVEAKRRLHSGCTI